MAITCGTAFRCRDGSQVVTVAPDRFVDTCLELLGPLEVGDETRQALYRYAHTGGELRFGSADEDEASAARIRRMLQLIVATQEYQFA